VLLPFFLGLSKALSCYYAALVSSSLSSTNKYSILQVALKLVPDNKTFTNLLMGKDGNNETLKEETQTLITLLSPFLEEIHSILVRSNSCLLTLYASMCHTVLICLLILISLFVQRVYNMDRLKST
jgi:hypothetical protein